MSFNLQKNPFTERQSSKISDHQKMQIKFQFTSLPVHAKLEDDFNLPGLRREINHIDFNLYVPDTLI